MDLTEDGSEDRTCTHTRRDAATIAPGPTEKDTAHTEDDAVHTEKDAVPTVKDTSIIPPAPTEKDVGTIHPAPTGEDVGMILPKHNEKEAGMIHYCPLRKKPERSCQLQPGKRPVLPQSSLLSLSRGKALSSTGLLLPAAEVAVPTMTTLQKKNV